MIQVFKSIVSNTRAADIQDFTCVRIGFRYVPYFFFWRSTVEIKQ